MSTLVSIIIPVYNRQDLIKETLESIQNQTYTQWECIVVDDGSTDMTEDVVSAFAKADTRIHFYNRPDSRKKGGNACRNYGFEKSRGSYINWFDSDDIMLPNFLEEKVKTMKQGAYDFVFSESNNFYPDGRQESIYAVDNTEEITAENFVRQQIGWITMDFMATRASLETLSFNETLTSGQEYNLIARYLCTTQKGVALHKKLALRRMHTSSIQSGVTKNKEENKTLYIKNTIHNKYMLLKDIYEYGQKSINSYLINSIIYFSFELAKTKNKVPNYSDIIRCIKCIKGVSSSIHYRIAIVLAFTTGKGYSFMKKAKK